MVWDLWCFEELEGKHRSVTQSVNYKGDCRTALATPGLVIIQNKLRWLQIIGNGSKRNEMFKTLKITEKTQNY